MTSHGLYLENESGEPTQQTAWLTPADPDDVAAVLSQPIGTGDGRSEWVWVRMTNGDLLLGVFPQGDTYMEMSDKGVCDFEWQDAWGN